MDMGALKNDRRGRVFSAVGFTRFGIAGVRVFRGLNQLGLSGVSVFSGLIRLGLDTVWVFKGFADGGEGVVTRPSWVAA